MYVCVVSGGNAYVWMRITCISFSLALKRLGYKLRSYAIATQEVG